MSIKQFLFLCLAIVITSVFLAGCSKEEAVKEYAGGKMQSAQPDEAPKPEQPEAKILKATVEIRDSGYVPEEVTIDAGGTVRWINKGTKHYSVQSEQFPQESSNDQKFSGSLAPGESWEKTINKPGYYGYYNVYDGSMKGKVIVR